MVVLLARAPVPRMKSFNIDKEILNSVILGISFLILYSAYYTLANLEELLLNSIHEEHPTFIGDGFTNLSVLYASHALFVCFVPPIMNIIGPKWTLTLGATGFCIPLTALLLEQGWLVYMSSMCNGVGSAMIWTSQFVYLMLNSTSSSIARNTGIVTGLCHSSMVYGNLFVYFCFDGKTEIDKGTRTLVLVGLLGLTLLAVIITTLLPPPAYSQDHDQCQVSTLQVVQQCWGVATSKNMLILIPMFLYTGIQLAYLSGIFGAAVGFTTYPDGFPSNQLVPVTGIFSGVGEISAGVFLFFANRLLTIRSWPLIVALGVLSDCLAFLFSFLNYSDASVFSPTSDPTIISSRPWIGLVIATLLGLSDGLFMPMVLSLFKKIYPNGNASSITVYTFGFSFGAAATFFFSEFFGLHLQLLVYSLVGIIGLLCYYYVSVNVQHN